MKTKKIISIIALLLVCVTLVSCSDNSAPEGMKKISGDDVAYNFYVYTQWVVDDSNKMCAYYSATDRSNVSMTTYIPDASFETVAEYYESIKKTYERDLQNFAIVEETTENVKMFEYSAYKLVYTFSFGEQDYKVMQVLTLHGDLIYVYTYTSSPELYDTHLQDAEAMLAEITFEA